MLQMPAINVNEHQDQVERDVQRVEQVATSVKRSKQMPPKALLVPGNKQNMLAARLCNLLNALSDLASSALASNWARL